MYKVADELDVVAGHDHLFLRVWRSLGEGKANRNVSRAQVHLRAELLHEGVITTTLVLRQDLVEY